MFTVTGVKAVRDCPLSIISKTKIQLDVPREGTEFGHQYRQCQRAQWGIRYVEVTH